MDGRWLGKRSERKPTEPIPLIPRERFVTIVRRSSGWLSRHGKPLLRSYEWHPAVVSPSLFLFLAPSLSLSLSLSAAAPPSRSSERDGESWAKEKTDGEREDKRRDTETLIITLAFMCASQGGVLASPVVLFLASAFTRLSS